MYEPRTMDAFLHPSKTPRWILPRPFCGAMHLHGAAEGDRAAHCEGARRPAEAYVLRFAGQSKPADLLRCQAAWYRRRDAGRIAGWHRAAQRLHALGAHAFAEAVFDVAQHHPAGDNLLLVFESYAARLTAKMIRAAGGDRFPPRPLAIVPPPDREGGA